MSSGKRGKKKTDKERERRRKRERDKERERKREREGERERESRLLYSVVCLLLEKMGAGTSTERVDEKRAVRHNKEIDDALRHEKIKESATVKLLLLGKHLGFVCLFVCVCL